MKKKFKQLWSTVPPISTKQSPLNTKKTTTYDVGDPDLVLERA